MVGDEFEYALHIVNGSLLIFLGVFATALNGILLRMLTKDPFNTFNRPLFKIDFALVLSNFCAGLVALPYLGIRELLQGTKVLRQDALRYASFGTALVNFIAAYRIVVLSANLIERYAAFVRPHWSVQFTSRRVTVSTILLASLCFLLDLVQFTGVAADTFYIMYFLVVISLPILISVVLALTIYCEIKTDRALHKVGTGTGLPPSEDSIKRSRVRRIRTANKYGAVALVVLIPSILCVVPWYVLQFISFHCSQCVKGKTGLILKTFFVSLLLAETVITPLTSIIKFPEYRQTVKRMFCARSNSTT